MEHRRDHARVLIVEGDRIAMIRRRRAGRTYYVLPGGGVEPGESFVAAAHREAAEELGVSVALQPEPVVEVVGDDRTAYFRARIVGGRFGTGPMPEAAVPPERRGEVGTYEPCWVPVDELPDLDVPAGLTALLEGRPMVRMTGLDHVVLPVADVDRSARFYADVLGLARVTLPDGSTVVRAGRHRIRLVATTPASEPTRLGLRTAENAAAVLAQLTAMSLAPETAAAVATGAAPDSVVTIRDPDGHLVDIVCPPR